MGKKNGLFLVLILCIGCETSKLPSTRYSQARLKISAALENNVLEIDIKNPLNCPIRIWMNNSDTDLQARFEKVNPVLLKPKSDTTYAFSGVKSFDNKNSYSASLGDPSKVIEKIKVELPFPKNREYRIIQGNNTSATHNTDHSRYAIDFSLMVNDTICSATNGFVVGVIDKYEFGGQGDQWKPFGNFVTIYEPNSGIFTQYVHLVKNGSLVQVGDKVKSGQPIALSGETGQTDIEHLHFNCLIPVDNSDDGMKSIPTEFVEGYRSIDLKRNDMVKK
ncbi:MAG: M23 family metallopeptidase [Bacteroidota bacterium]